MRRLVFFMGIFSTLMSHGQKEKTITTVYANYAKYAKENNQLLSNPNLNIRVVFMGNSITEMWKEAQPDTFNESLINRGIGGQTTAQMLLRFPTDVIALKPKKVVILAGTNDIAENNGPVTLEQIASNIEAMALLAQSVGIRPYVCAVLPARDYRWSPNKVPFKKIPKLNELIKQFCLHRNFDFIDTFTPMLAPDGLGLANGLHTDEVHLTPQGYTLLKSIIFKNLNP